MTMQYTAEAVEELLQFYAGMVVSGISEHNPEYFERIKHQSTNFEEIMSHASNSQEDLKARLEKALSDVERWQDNCAEMSDEVVRLTEIIEGDNQC